MTLAAAASAEFVRDEDSFDKLRALPPLPYFSESATRFVARFAESLLAGGSSASAASELAALGYWFRPSRVAALRESGATRRTSRRLARGLAFHIVPSNVDVLFCYTWLLSILAGNLNVIRLPQKRGPASR